MSYIIKKICEKHLHLWCQYEEIASFYDWLDMKTTKTVLMCKQNCEYLLMLLKLTP